MSVLSPQQLRDAVRDVGIEMFRIGTLALPAVIFMVACDAETRHVLLVGASGSITALVGFAATLWGCTKPRH